MDMTDTRADQRQISWDSLSADEQLKLRIEYGVYLDSLPPVCSMDTKVERFRRWLADQHGIVYQGPA